MMDPELEKFLLGLADSMKQTIWVVHAEKLLEDLWDCMRRDGSFDILCDPELNFECDVDRRKFIHLGLRAAGDVFNISMDPVKEN